MYDAIRAGLPTVDVPSGVAYDRARWMIDFIYNEAPELCALDLRKSTVIDNGSGMQISLKYNMAISDQEAFLQNVRKEAKIYSGNGSGGRDLRDI